MNRCFVIQPFDNGIYDKRFKDTFKPAIENNTGLEAYRIDADLSVQIPIDDIEQQIKDSIICFADISEDNPNVWYELGYAFAHGKSVVMVCSEERKGPFPFDIRHRNILKYKTGSKSDYEAIEESITNKINALLRTSKKVNTLVETPVVQQEGLNSQEIALLLLIAQNQFTSEETISVYILREEMNKAGYTLIATGVALRLLQKKGMLETSQESDWNNNYQLVCRLTAKGEDWVLSNQDKLVFRIDKSEQANDDLPF